MLKTENSPEHTWLAYCGNYCGDCLLFHGEVTDLAGVLLRRLKLMEHDQSAHHSPQLPHSEIYQQYCHRLYEALYSIDELRCTQLCREGGGSEFCKIRKCCVQHDLDGCWDCAELTQCSILQEFDAISLEAKMRTLLEIRENGVEGFLKDLKKRQKLVRKTPCHINPHLKSK
ncbi:DUF3795 domain-containing protein [candidate division KSB1 bacterium]|nr:DUF3795 domain-containing protein [candidate division KSB1 bacterium]